MTRVALLATIILGLAQNAASFVTTSGHQRVGLGREWQLTPGPFRRSNPDRLRRHLSPLTTKQTSDDPFVSISLRHMPVSCLFYS